MKKKQLLRSMRRVGCADRIGDATSLHKTDINAIYPPLLLARLNLNSNVTLTLAKAVNKCHLAPC